MVHIWYTFKNDSGIRPNKVTCEKTACLLYALQLISLTFYSFFPQINQFYTFEIYRKLLS